MNEPIRVLHVVGNMGAGGLETLIMNWYRTIDRNKIQFDFLVHKESRAFYEDEIIALGGRIYHCSFLNDYNYIKYKRFLKSFFAEHNEYKIIHGHHSALGVFYLKQASKAGIPARISHSHIANFSKTARGLIKYGITRLFGKYANIHFACSKAAGNYMYGSRYSFEVINNGIDVERFKYNEINRHNIRNNLNVNDKHVIIHVGRFHDQKNHSFLIDIFNEVHKIDSDTVLLMVGVGPLQKSIKNKVKELGLEDNCLFLNNRDDVQDLLSAADVFLFPSLYEGLPLTLIEAQTSGLPIVCSNTITLETRVTNNYYPLPLNMGSTEWAKIVIEHYYDDINRKDACVIVKDSGFDNNDVVEKMTELYCLYSEFH